MCTSWRTSQTLDAGCESHQSLRTVMPAGFWEVRKYWANYHSCLNFCSTATQNWAWNHRSENRRQQQLSGISVGVSLHLALLLINFNLSGAPHNVSRHVASPSVQLYFLAGYLPQLEWGTRAFSSEVGCPTGRTNDSWGQERGRILRRVSSTSPFPCQGQKRRKHKIWKDREMELWEDFFFFQEHTDSFDFGL